MTQHILAGVLICIAAGILIWMKFAVHNDDSDRREDDQNDR